MTKLYFILGCTACGKAAVGRALAPRVGGQIPPPEVRAEIRHHCIDIVEPSESFSAARYVEHADGAIAAVRRAGAVPLAVGATSLYIKALSEGLFEGPPADPDLRRSLRRRAEAEGLAALHAELARVDPAAAERIHTNDLRRIVRALEVHQTTGRPISELQRQWDAGRTRYECVFVGLSRDKSDINRRINARTRRMIQAGLKDEVAALLAEPGGLSDQAAQGVGYAEMIDHLRGRCTLDEAVERIKIHTRRLAKKQRTWHRRFRDVTWFDLTGRDDAEAIAEKILAAVRFE